MGMAGVLCTDAVYIPNTSLVSLAFRDARCFCIYSLLWLHKLTPQYGSSCILILPVQTSHSNKIHLFNKKVWKRCEQSCRAEETSQEAQKWFKAERGISVKQLNKGLAGCCVKVKVMLATIKLKQQQWHNQQQKYLHNQQLCLRDDVSTAWAWDSCSQKILVAANQNIGIDKFEYAISHFDVITAIQIVWTVLLKYVLWYLC